MLSKTKLKYLRSLHTRKTRNSFGVFVAEGPKVVNDLMDFGFVPIEVYATSSFVTSHTIDLVEVSEDELNRISLLESPQQVFAVFPQRRDSLTTEDFLRIPESELVIALDCVQNPGNLGTIIRLCNWFGIKHVFCSMDCADQYNPKTVQASMGAMAYVQVHYVDLPSLFHSLSKFNVPLYGTFLDGQSLYETNLDSNGVIIMGNEGRGISMEVEKFVNRKILIPPYVVDHQPTDSLNVSIATAIVCAEFRRRAL